MSDIVARLRTVTVPETRHVGFTYEAWAQEAADEIERLRQIAERLLTIITDSAAQTDRASPVVKGVTPDTWLPPGEEWWESFVDCVERQVRRADEKRN